MIMVNNIGGATLSAAAVAEKALEPKKIAAPTPETNADMSASVAAYLSLPGFNAPLQTDPNTTVNTADKASAVIKAVAESDDDSLKLALKQFDEGLKKLVQRPETQFFQAKFGTDNSAQEDGLVTPDPLPGVDENGLLGSGKVDMSADTNRDGKISPEELRRYQMPITYRSSQHAADAVADGPSAFSLTEANRAYGVVATADA
jgi:hypothetical protein